MNTMKELVSKTSAMEIVLIALLREKRDDAVFWDRVERIRAITWADLQKQLAPDELPMLEKIEDWLDAWRNMAGPEGNAVPPPSGP